NEYLIFFGFYNSNHFLFWLHVSRNYAFSHWDFIFCHVHPPHIPFPQEIYSCSSNSSSISSNSSETSREISSSASSISSSVSKGSSKFSSSNSSITSSYSLGVSSSVSIANESTGESSSC